MCRYRQRQAESGLQNLAFRFNQQSRLETWFLGSSPTSATSQRCDLGEVTQLLHATLPIPESSIRYLLTITILYYLSRRIIVCVKSLTLQLRSASNLQWSCFCLPSVGIPGLTHHVWISREIMKRIKLIVSVSSPVASTSSVKCLHWFLHVCHTTELHI